MGFNRGNRRILILFAVLLMCELVFSSTVSDTGSSVKFNTEKLPEEVGKWAVHNTMDGLVTAVIPSVAIIAPPPFGAAIAVGLGVMYSMVRPDKDEKTVMKDNLEIIQQANRIEKRIIEESQKIIGDLKFIIQTYPLLQNMRLDLETIEMHHRDRIDCVLNLNCTGDTKNNILDELLKPAGDVRSKLDIFSFKYLGSQSPPGNLVREKFYFDSILQQLQNEVSNDNDCFQDSYHSRIFKVTMYIAEVLSKGYSLITSAYYARYEILIESGNTFDANTVKAELAKTVNKCMDQLRILMLKAKEALRLSSREIRNCGPTTYTERETYHDLKIFETRIQDEYYKLFYGCINEFIPAVRPSFNNDDVYLFGCITLENGPIYDAYYSINEDGVRVSYHCLGSHPRSETITTFASQHKKWGKGLRVIFKHKKRYMKVNNAVCPLKLCHAQKYGNKIRFNSILVEAQPGNVVTGVRWVFKSNVIFIQIQEGKFIDATHVDEKTVEWQNIIYGDIIELDEKTEGVVLEDLILPEKTYLTGVKLVLMDKKLTLSVKGFEFDVNKTKIWHQEERRFILGIRKLEMDHPDDPAAAPNDNKTLVMRHQGTVFAKFQPTDFEKDFGLHTIPYFDLQKVETNPPAPISGIGIYHKAAKGYGGFLGLKLLSPDFTYMMNMERFESFVEKLKPYKS